jgi:16S rRNA (cytidine1402-2'-O)-methyltransferase
VDGARLLSLHAHSSERTITSAVAFLENGESVAVITDAGMPSVSDPGADLVRAAREAKIEVTVLPGPSAVTAAVALSGLVDGPFSFLGFLPRKGSKRTRALASIMASEIPCVLFESPHRVEHTLADLQKHCGGSRSVAVCRELTKKFEETYVGPLSELTSDEFAGTYRGEFTLVVAGSGGPQHVQEEIDVSARAVALLDAGCSVKDAAQALCDELTKNGEKRSRRELYTLVLDLSKKRPGDDHFSLKSDDVAPEGAGPR